MEEEARATAAGAASGGAGPASEVTEVRVAGLQPLRLLEWKVSAGSAVKIGSVLAVCAPIQVVPARPSETGSPRPAERKVKAERPGVVRELCAQRGQVIPPGSGKQIFSGCSQLYCFDIPEDLGFWVAVLCALSINQSSSLDIKVNQAPGDDKVREEVAQLLYSEEMLINKNKLMDSTSVQEILREFQKMLDNIKPLLSPESERAGTLADALDFITMLDNRDLQKQK
ncbi:UNVERIFIED_CONTAM: hypothetical protein K2H54_056155 [Gekko kuhli]